ncbi:hypothetical protein [Zavarzinia sp.]|uniref:hypothetical protein n=1 Tax=Zavarzinia sp. TaxID=2027920 RepID=UPI003BB549BC
MDTIEQNLAIWRESLLQSISIGGLLSRNPVVYKWKAPFRVWELRELAFWREHDLMAQSYALHRQGHGLGARILLRSGFETLATLIHVNMLMRQVLEGELKFHVFAEKTSVLLLGSRNNDLMPTAINIVTVLEKCDKRYPGLKRLYAELSESAHPNYEGLIGGYSVTDYREFETTFSNRWMDLHGERHPDRMKLCMETFHYEYNDVWPDLMNNLEDWIEKNEKSLEESPKAPLSNT